MADIEMNRRKFLGIGVATGAVSALPIVNIIFPQKEHPWSWLPNGSLPGPHLVSWDEQKTWEYHGWHEGLPNAGRPQRGVLGDGYG